MPRLSHPFAPDPAPALLPLDPRWERQFEEERVSSGREMARRGRVSQLDVSDGGYRIGARVGGTNEVKIRLQLQIAAGTRVIGTCSCGVSNCEHAAAALFVALNEHGTAVARPRQATVSFGGKSVTVPLPGNDEDEGKPFLEMHYVLCARRLHRGLEVSLYAADPGTPDVVREFDPTIWRREFKGTRLSDEDTSLIAGVCNSRTWLGHQGHELINERGCELFQRLLHRGRAQWEKIGRPMLQGAGARSVTVEWRRDAEGSQRPHLLAEGIGEVMVFDLGGAWYVHPETGQCGWTESTVPLDLLLRWQRLGAVSPAQVPAFCDEHRSLFPEHVVPLPAVAPERWITGTRPRPFLTFFGGSRAESSPQDTFSFQGCRVGWDYGGVVVDWCAPGESVDRWKDGELARTTRDPGAEAVLVGRLKETGLMPVEDGPVEMWTLVDSNPIAWSRLVLEALPRLEAEGWQIDCEETFRYRFAAVDTWFTGARDEKGWFALELGVMVDGQRIDLIAPLVETIRECHDWFMPGVLDHLPDDQVVPVGLPDGRMAAMPLSRLRPALQVLVELQAPKLFRGDRRVRVSRLRAAELAGLDGYQWTGSKDLRAMGERLRNFAGLRPVPPPAGLRAELRHYQAEGLNWLQFLREYDLAGILADDMGLGKTLQALAHLLAEREQGRADLPSLVVAPTSLVPNWQAEAARFAPGLKLLVLHGADRRERFGEIPKHDLVLTTYPLLMRDIEALERTPFHLVILDEAQFVKNARARTSECVRRLRARHRLCLTGTPMENHLGELWALFDFLLPGLLGDEGKFRVLYRTPIEKQGDDARRDALAARVRPFLLRRTKESVAAELPVKTEMTRLVELPDCQQDLYESIRAAAHERVRAEVEAHGLERSRIVILDALLKLRQVCCDPRLVKMEAASRVQESAKLEMLMEMLPELIDEGRRVLLFSQFTTMLALVEREVRKRKIPFVKLTGSTRDRSAPVASFQNGEVPLFLISLKAGGTGLNLTAADTVIHYDPWWNPAVEAQATDRAHRIGQEKSVFVFKLIAAGTVEEKIATLQQRKKKLVGQLLGEAKGEKLELSAADLESLFEPLPEARN